MELGEEVLELLAGKQGRGVVTGFGRGGLLLQVNIYGGAIAFSTEEMGGKASRAVGRLCSVAGGSDMFFMVSF